MSQFFAWNPAVSTDCKTNFWKNQAYCVGTSGSISVSRSAPPTPTPTSGLIIPSPNQPNNAVSNCNKVAQALSGDYCAVGSCSDFRCFLLTRNDSCLPNATESPRRSCTRGIEFSIMAMLVVAPSGRTIGTVSAYEREARGGLS